MTEPPSNSLLHTLHLLTFSPSDNTKIYDDGDDCGIHH